MSLLDRPSAILSRLCESQYFHAYIESMDVESMYEITRGLDGFKQNNMGEDKIRRIFNV